MLGLLPVPQKILVSELDRQREFPLFLREEAQPLLIYFHLHRLRLSLPVDRYAGTSRYMQFHQ